jgi:plastocyanin
MLFAFTRGGTFVKSLHSIGALTALCIIASGCGGSSVSTTPVGPHAWTVSAGSSSANEALQALEFYPASMTVDAGDTVVFTSPTAEVHSISIPIPGASAPPAGDPTAAGPVGGTTYDGTAYISSGFIAGGATYSVTFTKPGTYAYYSIPQGFVSGTVIVQNAGAPYPTSQAAYAATASTAIASDLASAKASIATIPYTTGSTKIAAGVSAGGAAPASSSVMRFMDGPMEGDNLRSTIHLGTTLTFTNLSNNVPHTVTFPAAGQTPAPGAPDRPASGGTTYDGTQTVNSGVIPPGGVFKLTFTATGTYTYYCLFHDGSEGMTGTVTVTP